MNIHDLAQKVASAIEDEFGSLDECCTLGNRSMWELCRKIGEDFRLTRIAGYVVCDDEAFEHEWAEFDGEMVDSTYEQFSGELEYIGSESDWPHLSETEMAEVRGIVDAVSSELTAEALAEYMDAD